MPAPPPESEPAIVSIAGVLPPPITGKVFIIDKVSKSYRWEPNPLF